ncbi:MAG: polyribonucleotide nucleotidyltransferase [Candidatus Harrisonbacteria bacterium RIFCSPHIGHO2_02_FULL_42_16]|uniref:Polyribonucleotide nucleotidyltransferase n=1 Tax=Candidatus Harrisonbacteria bacterium RIFCSPHIGHO2_02_FULL_42_16 TaxID=1798404 RepID=A0A1G1ZHT8_9BACT|nr:MAG: polyribonucleotide nucleotidyltransferase [Candidatus Harrisonbacteria bacterium RIFCSPHIGHO2_02_FULL_42_16]
MDLERKQYKTEFAGQELILEISRIAEQANAAVIGKYGDTAVLATAVMSEKDKAGDYFPLMVNYEEKFYAAGKILGSRFMRREGRSSDEAILSGRIIDRTIRPLFNQSTRREVQVVVTTLSYDGENDPDFISLIAASTALGISNIPWNGPVAGVTVAKIKSEEEFLINPKISELKEKPVEFKAFTAGTKDRINMVELEGDEADESSLLKGFEQAQKDISDLVDFQEKIIKELGKKKEKVAVAEPDKKVEKEVSSFLKNKLEAAVFHPNKIEMKHKIGELKNSLKEMLADKKFSESEIAGADTLFEEEINQLVHKKALKEEKRPDGRKLDEVRELYAETGLFKRLHGSALFVRGNTQSLALTTLGGPGDQQLMETIEFSGKRRFMLHYNFPPYSVGEIRPFRGPGRRDIGHGALAEKALRQLLPPKEQFPYTIRLVSEILSSNGSSSMATVCAGSLSLMDAGVPIRRPAAGIAMGLMMDENGKEYKVLTDIQGPEDHHGDMDFKIAGTEQGVTAMQLDVKIQGLTSEIIAKTMEQAKKARLHILKTINQTLSQPREKLSPFAPAILSLHIDPERIGELIGPGGKVINGIIEKTGATDIDIEEDGTVFITASNQEIGQKAYDEVSAIMKEYAIGDIVEGTVVKILDFGAILEFGPGKDGMIHVSELKEGFVKKVEDVVKVGDIVRAKIVKKENGKIGLSIKQLNR